MIISDTTWTLQYIGRLRKLNDEAADKMLKYLKKHIIVSLQDWNALINYAYGVSTTYGEAAATIAAEFYDAVAKASGVIVPAAIPAETATYAEVAKSVRGTGKSGNHNLMANSVSRLVKMAGVDTTVQNAVRDQTEIAWIPHGDTCAFCLTLASRGWQRASRKTIKNGHAEHVHANCDCTYAVRFNEDTEVEGYNNGKAYLDFYKKNKGAATPQEAINNMRSVLYENNPEAKKKRHEYYEVWYAEHKEELKAKREAKKRAQNGHN